MSIAIFATRSSTILRSWPMPGPHAHIKDTTDLYAAIANGTLPSVSFVKPSVSSMAIQRRRSSICLRDSSKRSSLSRRPTHPVGPNGHHHNLRRRRRILGFRLCPAARFLRRRHPHPGDRRVAIQHGGHISHTYADHVSILKFIEKNWSSARSPRGAETICPTQS